ncbi:hypothetical protein ACOJB1_06035 [Enterococcus innesii]
MSIDNELDTKYDPLPVDPFFQQLVLFDKHGSHLLESKKRSVV